MKCVLYRLCALLFALALLICAAMPTLAAGDEPDTPEAAIEAFVTAIAANDYEAAMALFSMERIVQGYDWAQQITRTGATPQTLLGLPAPPALSPFHVLSQKALEGRMAASLYNFSASFLIPEEMLYAMDADPATLAAFVEQIDPARLKDLEALILFDPPESKNERMIELFTQQAAPYGADEKVEKGILYQLGKQRFLGGFQLMRYGDTWVLSSLQSVLMNMNAYGSVTPIPENEWEAALEALAEMGVDVRGLPTE